MVFKQADHELRFTLTDLDGSSTWRRRLRLWSNVRLLLLELLLQRSSRRRQVNVVLWSNTMDFRCLGTGVHRAARGDHRIRLLDLRLDQDLDSVFDRDLLGISIGVHDRVPLRGFFKLDDLVVQSTSKSVLQNGQPDSKRKSYSTWPRKRPWPSNALTTRRPMRSSA